MTKLNAKKLDKYLSSTTRSDIMKQLVDNCVTEFLFPSRETIAGGIHVPSPRVVKFLEDLELIENE